MLNRQETIQDLENDIRKNGNYKEKNTELMEELEVKKNSITELEEINNSQKSEIEKLQKEVEDLQDQ